MKNGRRLNHLLETEGVTYCGRGRAGQDRENAIDENTCKTCIKAYHALIRDAFGPAYRAGCTTTRV